MSISPEEALEREDSPASSLIGGSEGGKLAEYEEIAARAYDGFVVRKDLVGQVKGNAIVPSYVLEFLLAQYCATTSEAAIVEGVESVRRILAKHYVNRGDSELIKSRIREEGQYRIIDKVSVNLDETHDRYNASFENLGVTNALVSDETVRENDRLLTGGVWCLAEMSYVPMGDSGAKASSRGSSPAFKPSSCRASIPAATARGAPLSAPTSGSTCSSPRSVSIPISSADARNSSS